jgi:DNA topoisomerase VI subunit A
LRWGKEFNGARVQGTNKGVSHLTLEKDFVLVVETMEVATKVKRKPKPEKV